MPTRFLFLCLFLAATLQAGAEALKPPSVTLSLSVVSWGAAIPDLYYKSGSTLEKIAAPAFQPSAPFRYTGPAELVFYARVSPELEAAFEGAESTSSNVVRPKAKKSQENEIEAGRVLLPSDESRVTVLLAPAESGRYKCFAIPGDPTKFPYGRARLLNLHDQPLAIKFNRSGTVMLKPRESHVVAPGVNSSLLIEVATYKREKWRRLFDNIFTIGEDEQATVIFSRGDYKFFRTDAGEVESEVHVTVLRQKKEDPVADRNAVVSGR